MHNNCERKKYNISCLTKSVEPVFIDSPVWQSAEVGFVECENWGGYAKSPKTEFRMLRDKNGFYLLMHTAEQNLRAEIKEQNGNVYQDSCMEFFFSPDINSENYLNFEFNPSGVLHLGFGKNRHNRLLIDVTRDVFQIESSAKEGDWSLMFYVPDKFLLEYFDEVSDVMRANFYKCGDFTDHQHYASWSVIETESPDFHRPEFFGSLAVSE